jgi:large subunit ribosomal protein L21
MRGQGFEREDRCSQSSKPAASNIRVAANETLQIEKLPGEAGEQSASPKFSCSAATSRGSARRWSRGLRACRDRRAEARPQGHHLQKAAPAESRRKNGHRQEYTVVRVTDIVADGASMSRSGRKPTRLRAIWLRHRTVATAPVAAGSATEVTVAAETSNA